jgi:hypothetical protein
MAPQQQQQQQQQQENSDAGNAHHSEQTGDKEMSVDELLYSTTSFHAIVKPGMLSMLSCLYTNH